MIGIFMTILTILIISPAAVLWLVAEILYIVVFFIKVFSSMLYILSLAVSANFDSYIRNYMFYNDIIGTTKKLIRTEIAEQMKALRLLSVFFERKR
jgi:hypothetical protein